MSLPVDFISRMEQMLGREYGEFIATYDMDRAYGMRYNTLKISRDRFEAIVNEKIVNNSLKPVKWASEGYYYDKDTQPGKAALHEAGAYYIQEPSAMSAAELLEVKPGEIVCDMCAAPGGKSTQIAGKLQGEGLLVANEFYSSRAKILSQNIERMGVRNAVVLNESTDRIADYLSEFFDKVMVDAPCSGEGMFRKDEAARDEWSLEQVQVCADRQAMILDNAARILKRGGVLVYSTCTFAEEENEETVAAFIERNPEFYIDKPSNHEELLKAGFTKCYITSSDGEKTEVDGMYRLWPHKLQGEGHFAVRLVKGGNKDGADEYRRKYVTGTKKKEELKYYEEFAKTTLNIELAGEIVLFGDSLYLVPSQMIDLKGLKIERAGLKLGYNKKNRFEPDHALALALKPEDVKQSVELVDEKKYIRGETVECMYDKGWTLVTVDGVSIGWGKAQNSVLKNHYPKGLRRG